MNDPCEDICDALVTFVNGLRNTESNPLAPITCEASKPENPSGLLKLEHKTIQVLVFPSGEEEDKIGRGGQVLERYEVTMLVVRQLSSEFTRVALSRFVRSLKSAIRGQRMAGFVYSTAETVSKFDPERIHESNQFVSAVKFTYSGTAGPDG